VTEFRSNGAHCTSAAPLPPLPQSIPEGERLMPLLVAARPNRSTRRCLIRNRLERWKAVPWFLRENSISWFQILVLLLPGAWHTDHPADAEFVLEHAEAR
jgi:hypothetical protein